MGGNVDRQQLVTELIEGEPTPAVHQGEESVVAVDVLRGHSAILAEPLLDHGVEVVGTVQVEYAGILSGHQLDILQRAVPALTQR